jgi:hypothetical protein
MDFSAASRGECLIDHVDFSAASCGEFDPKRDSITKSHAKAIFAFATFLSYYIRNPESGVLKWILSKI